MSMPWSVEFDLHIDRQRRGRKQFREGPAPILAPARVPRVDQGARPPEYSSYFKEAQRRVARGGRVELCEGLRFQGTSAGSK